MADDEGNVSSDAYCSSDDEDLGRCVGYNTIKMGKKELGDDKEQKQGKNKSFKVNKVTTRSRAKTGECTSKSPQTPMKAITSGEGCSESPKWTKAKIASERVKPVCGFRLYASWMSFENSFQIKSLKPEHKCSRNYNLGVKDGWLAGFRKVIGLDGCFLKHTCRGELLVAIGRDANNQMYPIAWVVMKLENNDNWHWMVIPSGFQELEVRKGHEAYRVKEVELVGGLKEQGVREAEEGVREAMEKTQESIAANMSDKGEIGFRLGDFEAEDNHKSNAELGITSAEPIAAVSPSADKGKQVAEPSEEANPEPQAKKKGSKRKAPTSSEELPLRIIYHKNKGRSERIFNQKMKKSGFGPNGEGSTRDKAFSFM
ncbi:calcium/proton exchanger [Tanacetum coccineum]